MSDDVKELLGRAFGQEPPLGIDRDAVLREGRKRLRRRRYLASGGVVAAVVVAAVGAATLTNLADSTAPDQMPPAASRTGTPTSTDAPPPPSSQPPNTTTESTLTPGSTLWAKELTRILYKSPYLSEDKATPVGDSDRAKFRVNGDKYVYQADLVGPKSSGYVEIWVEPAQGSVPACEHMTGYAECGIRKKGDVDVLVARHVADTGQVTTYARGVLPDGSMITVTATNLPTSATKAGSPPTAPFPVLDDDALCYLVARSGLRVG